MRILFSGSESKAPGGVSTFSEHTENIFGGIDARTKLIAAYESILASGDNSKKQTLTGWKKLEDIDALPVKLSEATVLIAIERFSGVGFQYLSYDTLPDTEQTFIEENMLIFSNLLGPVRANDRIPETKLKQGVKLGKIDPTKHYKELLSDEITAWIGEDVVLDLRAGAYKKMYAIPKNVSVIEPVFFKNGKSVSHWSKAYRGEMARLMAKQQPASLGEAISVIEKSSSISDIHQTKHLTKITIERSE